jgi:hypothetical protein
LPYFRTPNQHLIRNESEQETLNLGIIAMSDKKMFIRPEMTILDIVSRYRQTESVFKAFDEKAGVCLCCEALFDPLKDVAAKYGLSLEKLLSDLDSAANASQEKTFR